MLSNSFQVNYVLVAEPRNSRFTLSREKREERAYYLGAAYGYFRGCLAGVSEKGYLGAVKCLVSQGANIHVNDEEALTSASYYGHSEVVKYLMESGANVHANNDEALKCASRNGHLEVIKFLAPDEANVHASDNEMK